MEHLNNTVEVDGIEYIIDPEPETNETTKVLENGITISKRLENDIGDGHILKKRAVLVNDKIYDADDVLKNIIYKFKNDNISPFIQIVIDPYRKFIEKSKFQEIYNKSSMKQDSDTIRIYSRIMEKYRRLEQPIDTTERERLIEERIIFERERLRQQEERIILRLRRLRPNDVEERIRMNQDPNLIEFRERILRERVEREVEQEQIDQI